MYGRKKMAAILHRSHIPALFILYKKKNKNNDIIITSPPKRNIIISPVYKKGILIDAFDMPQLLKALN